DPRAPAGGERCIGRPDPRAIPRPDRVRSRLVPVRRRRDGAQGHLPHRPAGRGGRPGGHERRRQIHPDRPDPAVSRRHPRSHPGGRRGRPPLHADVAAEPDRARDAGHVPVQRPRRGQQRLRVALRDPRGDPARRAGGVRPRLHRDAPGRLRDHRRRAGGQGVGRPAAADRAGPGVPEGSGDPDPGRGDLGPGRRERVHHPARAGRSDQRTHGRPDRAPAVDGAPGPPHRGVPRGAHRRGGHARRPPRPGRHLPTTARAPVRDHGAGGLRERVARHATRLPSAPGSRDWLGSARDGALLALFAALAFSISLSQLLVAALSVLLLPWRGAPGAAGGAAASLALLPRLRAAGERARRHPLTPPLAAYAGWTLLSAALSGNPGWSFWIARDLLRAAVLYLVLAGTHDGRHAVRLWQAFLAALTLMAGYGLVQAWVCAAGPTGGLAGWAGALCTHARRIRGPFSCYMTFGGVLLLGVLVFLAHLANTPWRRAWWMVPGATLTVLALAFTYSRNAWMGLAAGVLGPLVTARRTVRVVAILAVVLAAASIVIPGTVADRVRSTVNLQDPTIRDRVAMWRAGLSMIADHPLFGVGPGEVRAWYQHYRRPEAIRPSTGHLH